MGIHEGKSCTVPKRKDNVYIYSFTPQNFAPWAKISYVKDYKFNYFHLLTINDAQSLMSKKYKPLLQYKLHPNAVG